MSKKTFFKTTALVAVLGSTLLGGNAMGALPQNATAIEVPAQTIQLTQEWDKIFPQSDKVEHRKVTFKNRYGLTLVGDLYVPTRRDRQITGNRSKRSIGCGKRANIWSLCPNVS
ncbi:hypothetical protein [Neisseria sp. HMSC070A01]|uniref:hypothetical protein n=1 Tax=Neisseria sp. HMSC070A01 TaxID=1715190 RepID=UPI0024B1D76C|nr:hypothetical protein [Neisseria sp. HMSC070A01]